MTQLALDERAEVQEHELLLKVPYLENGPATSQGLVDEALTTGEDADGQEYARGLETQAKRRHIFKHMLHS